MLQGIVNMLRLIPNNLITTFLWQQTAQQQQSIYSRKRHFSEKHTLALRYEMLVLQNSLLTAAL